MATRVTIEGTLCVFRESSLSSHLSCDVSTTDGKEIYYPKAPKCFDDIISDGQNNLCDVKFTANEDGRNPRNVKALSECRHTWKIED